MKPINKKIVVCLIISILALSTLISIKPTAAYVTPYPEEERNGITQNIKEILEENRIVALKEVGGWLYAVTEDVWHTISLTSYKLSEFNSRFSSPSGDFIEIVADGAYSVYAVEVDSNNIYVSIYDGNASPIYNTLYKIPINNGEFGTPQSLAFGESNVVAFSMKYLNGYIYALANNNDGSLCKIYKISVSGAPSQTGSVAITDYGNWADTIVGYGSTLYASLYTESEMHLVRISTSLSVLGSTVISEGSEFIKIYLASEMPTPKLVMVKSYSDYKGVNRFEISQVSLTPFSWNEIWNPVPCAEREIQGILTVAPSLTQSGWDIYFFAGTGGGYDSIVRANIEHPSDWDIWKFNRYIIEASEYCADAVMVDYVVYGGYVDNNGGNPPFSYIVSYDWNPEFKTAYLQQQSYNSHFLYETEHICDLEFYGTDWIYALTLYDGYFSNGYYQLSTNHIDSEPVWIQPSGYDGEISYGFKQFAIGNYDGHPLMVIIAEDTNGGENDVLYIVDAETGEFYGNFDVFDDIYGDLSEWVVSHFYAIETDGTRFFTLGTYPDDDLEVWINVIDAWTLALDEVGNYYPVHEAGVSFNPDDSGLMIPEFNYDGTDHLTIVNNNIYVPLWNSWTSQGVLYRFDYNLNYITQKTVSNWGNVPTVEWEGIVALGNPAYGVYLPQAYEGISKFDYNNLEYKAQWLEDEQTGFNDFTNICTDGTYLYAGLEPDRDVWIVQIDPVTMKSVRFIDNYGEGKEGGMWLYGAGNIFSNGIHLFVITTFYDSDYDEYYFAIVQYSLLENSNPIMTENFEGLIIEDQQTPIFRNDTWWIHDSYRSIEADAVRISTVDWWKYEGSQGLYTYVSPEEGAIGNIAYNLRYPLQDTSLQFVWAGVPNHGYSVDLDFGVTIAILNDGDGEIIEWFDYGFGGVENGEMYGLSLSLYPDEELEGKWRWHIFGFDDNNYPIDYWSNPFSFIYSKAYVIQIDVNSGIGTNGNITLTVDNEVVIRATELDIDRRHDTNGIWLGAYVNENSYAFEAFFDNIILSGSTLSYSISGNRYSFNFEFYTDWEDYVALGDITYKLLKDGVEIPYASGAYTLTAGQYVLNTYYCGARIYNEFDDSNTIVYLTTEFSGNNSIVIYLSLWKWNGGFIGADVRPSEWMHLYEIYEDTQSKLNFTMNIDSYNPPVNIVVGELSNPPLKFEGNGEAWDYHYEPSKRCITFQATDTVNFLLRPDTSSGGGGGGGGGGDGGTGWSGGGSSPITKLIESIAEALRQLPSWAIFAIAGCLGVVVLGGVTVKKKRSQSTVVPSRGGV